jgi:hypothetical protein
MYSNGVSYGAALNHAVQSRDFNFLIGFVFKLLPSLIPTTLITFGSSEGYSYVECKAVATDPVYSNVFTGGVYYGNVYIWPGSESPNGPIGNLANTNISSGFIACFDDRIGLEVTFKWAVTISYASVVSIAVDAQQNSYVSGTYSGTPVVYDTGNSGVVFPTSTTGAFYIKLDSTGKIVSY